MGRHNDSVAGVKQVLAAEMAYRTNCAHSKVFALGEMSQPRTKSTPVDEIWSTFTRKQLQQRHHVGEADLAELFSNCNMRPAWSDRHHRQAWAVTVKTPYNGAAKPCPVASPVEQAL
jgi:hypothetical protein